MARNLKLLFLGAVVSWLSLPEASFGAITLGFQNVTANSTANAQTGETQLTVEVQGTADDSNLGSNQVRFIFRNAGPNASSITDIYFDDGTLLGIAAIEQDGNNVDFSQGAKPGNLPGGDSVGFVSTASFSIDSNPPTQPNGVNPGEEIGIVFTLQPGLDYDDLVAALGMLPSVDGSLGIGIHVQGFADGGSESFVSTNYPPPVVPEPATILVWSGLATSAVAMGFVRRRRLSG